MSFNLGDRVIFRDTGNLGTVVAWPNVEPPKLSHTAAVLDGDDAVGIWATEYFEDATAHAERIRLVEVSPCR